MIRRVLLFTISLLFSKALYSQTFSFDGFRVGLDPVKSATFLLKDKQHKFLYFPNTLEGYSELLLFGNTSVVFEPGYSKTFLQLPSRNYQYESRGYYLRAGLDFNISHPEEKAEITLGWRFGMNEYTEEAQSSFYNEYYGKRLSNKLPANRKKFIWGELVLTHKYCLYKHPVNKSKLYFAVSLRIKNSNRLPSDPYPSLAIPGYGLYKKYVPAVNFALFYQYTAKKSMFKDLKHRKQQYHKLRREL